MKFKFNFRCVSMDVLLCRFFRSYAYYLNRYRWLFLIVPLIFSGIGSSGFYFLTEQTVNQSVLMYTPIQSNAEYEKAVLNEHWPLIPDRFFSGKYYSLTYRAELLVQAKDDGNLLRGEYLNATIEVNQFILENLTVLSYDKLTNINYSFVCLNWEGDCYGNNQLDLLLNAEKLDKYIPVTYPITRQGDAPFYLASSVGGVKFVAGDSTGRFDYVRTLRLVYWMKPGPPPINVYSRQWMLRLEEVMRNYDSPYLKFAIFHSETLDQGLQDNATRLVPKFSITFVVLGLFCALCSFVLLQEEEEVECKEKTQSRRYWTVARNVCRRLGAIDWVMSKPGLALVGLISSGLAISTAMGIMLLTGWKFNSVVCVMPFLVISIGVNDMCIMTTAWHRTPVTAPVKERLADTLSEAAVAISITSITDVISFAIGSWSSLPAVIMFCSYTSVALLLEYLFQITFFAAAFAFYGHAEAQARHCIVPCIKAVPADQKGLNWFQKIFLRGTVITGAVRQNESNAQSLSTLADSSRERSVERETPIMRFFRLKYAPAVLHPIGRTIVLIIYASYLGFAFWGCTKIREGLKFTNLVPRDHYMMHYVQMIPDFWHEGMQAQIVVSSPPNLALSSEREKLLGMVHRFENTTHTMDSNATMFFLNEYIRYLDQMNAAMGNSTEIWYTQFKGWLAHTGSSASWLTDLQWDSENDTNLLAFRFQIGLRNFATGVDHTQAAAFVRQLAAEYPEYNVSTYHEYWPFVDQYMSIRPNVIQDNIIAVISMIIIATIFIPNLACGIFITLSMLSINIGVFGYMTWWNVDLDCISMITSVMALGFAIDYSAHICYAYVSAQDKPTLTRTIAALETLGWPVFQGALTIIFGTFVLATVDGYLVQTFFKTVFLSILFGLLHSVVFLPVALASLLPKNGIRIRQPLKEVAKKIHVYVLRNEISQSAETAK